MKGRLFVTPKSQNEILNTSRTKTEFLLKEDMILSKVSNTTYFNSNNINLVRNSDYLDEMNRWQKNSPDITHDPTVKYDGANSVKISKTGLTANAWTTMLSEPVPVVVGNTYTASVYVYTDDYTTIDAGVGLEIQWYDATNINNRLGTVGVPVNVTTNGVWTRFSVTATMPAGAVQARLRYHITKNGRMWFSKPMFEKGEVASAWRPHVDDMVVEKGTQRDIPIRYIRDWLNGSTANAGSHWVEIQAIKDGVNVALNKPVTGNVPENPTYPYSRITDGTISSAWAGASIEDGNPRCVTVDLGSIVYNIEHLQIYHYYADGRQYKQTKTEVSADGINWTTLFDSAVSGMYAESSAGKKIYVNTHESLRKAESSITQTANKISLVVSETDTIKGDALVSAINIQPGTVQISAKNVNIEGAVKFSSLDSSVRSSLVDSAAPENIFPNGKFEDWEGTVPNGWTRWTGAGNLTKTTSAISHGFAPKFAVTATQNDGFLFVLNGKPENQYYIAEFGFMIESGNGQGAGLLLRHHNGLNGGASYKEVKIQISDYIPNPVIGQWYTIRTFVEIPKFGGTTSYSGYVMANWEGFAGAVRTAKTINFDKVLWRPATENEIQTNNKWVAKKYAIGAQASASYEPTFEMLSRFSVAESKMVNDAASFTNVFTGDYYAIHYATAVFVPQDKNVTFPSVVADDSVAIYVNGNKVGFKAGTTASSMVLPLKTGWNNIDVLVYEHAGGESVGFGTKLSDSVLLMQPSQNPASYNSAISDGLARVITDMSAIEENVTKINGGRILTNSITAKQIAANTIRAENLFVGDMTNMMQYDENAIVTGRTVITHTDNLKYFKTGPTAWMGIELTRSEKIEFKVGDSYYVGFNGFKESAITGNINMIVRYYYTDGSGTNAGLATIPFTTSVTSLETVVKITAAPTIGKTISYVSFFVEKDNTTSGYFYMRNIELRKMYAGKMIVDGTIDANKVTIASSTAGVTIDSNGVVANNASTGVKAIMNSTTGFEIKKGTDTVFTVDSLGNLTAKNITIVGGTISWGTGLGQTPAPSASQVGAATPAEVDGKIKDISVGGRNLIQNSGMFRSMTGWFNAGTLTTKDGYPVIYSTGTGYVSTGNLQILEPNTEYVCTMEIMLAANYPANNVVPNHIYAKRVADNVDVHGGMTLVGGNRTLLANKWEKVSVTFKTDATTDPIYFKVHDYTSSTAVDKWLRSVKLEKGNKPTDWSPAPEDAIQMVDDIKIGGRNFVQWQKVKDAYPLVAGTKAFDVDRFGNTDRALKITGGASSASYRIANVIPENGKYSISFWYKTSDTSGFSFDLCDSPSDNPAGSTAWKEYKMENFTIGNFNSTFHFLDLTVPAGKTLWISHIKVEKGSKASDYTEAQEDTYQAIDNVTVGGVNLIPNSNPMTTTANWTALGGGTVSIIDDATANYVYKKALRYTSTTSATGFYHGQIERLVEGKVYTWSGYFKGSRNGMTIKPGHEQGGNMSITLTTAWTYYKYTFVATSSSYQGFTIYKEGMTFAAGDTIDVHSLKLEEGTKATMWTESPADLKTKLDTAQSTASSAKAMTDDMTSDMKVTPLEKNELRRLWDSIKAENGENRNIANNLGVSLTAYDTAYNALNGSPPRIETEVLASMTSTYTFGSGALRDNFRTQMNNYFTQRNALLTAIANKQKANADQAQRDATVADAIALTGTGKMLHRDPMFKNGWNESATYNNSGNGNVSYTRIAKSADAPTSSDYMMRITTTASPTSPGNGGFYFGDMTRAGMTIVTRIIAKLPVGTTIQWASNATGIGRTESWLTPQAGTGKFEEYVHRLIAGTTRDASNDFSTTSYYYTTGGTLPVIVDVAYATTWDVTTIDTTAYDVDVLTGRWKYPTSTNIGGDFIESGTISADKLRANTLTAREIGANTIVTKNLLVSDFTNLIENGGFETDANDAYPKGWVVNRPTTEQAVKDSSGFVNGNGTNRVMGLKAVTSGNNDVYADNIIPVQEGDEFYVDMEGRYMTLSGTGTAKAGFRLYDKKGAPLSWTEVISFASKSTSFGKGTSLTSPVNVYKVPANVGGIQFWVVYQQSSENSNWFYFDNVNVRRRSAGTLIVDGSITADKIEVGAVRADKIDVNAIRGKTIKLGGFDNATDIDIQNGSMTVYDSSNRIIFSADESGTNVSNLAISGDLRMTGSTGRLYTDSYAERTSYTHPCWTGQSPGDTSTENANNETDGGDYNNGNIVIYVMGQSVLKTIAEARDGTINRPFTSIQEAIDSVPKILDHNVTIRVYPYRYLEDINITGFTGTGTLEIKTCIWGVRKIIDVSNGSTSNTSDHWTKMYFFEENDPKDVTVGRDKRMRDHTLLNPPLGNNSWTVSNVTTTNSVGVNALINSRKMPTANMQTGATGDWIVTASKSSTTPSNGEEFVAGKGYVRIDMGREYDLAGIKVFKYTGGLKRDNNGRLISNAWRAYSDVQTWVSGSSTNGFELDYTQGDMSTTGNGFYAANDGAGSFLSWGGFMKVWDNNWIPRQYYYETEYGHLRGGVIAGKIEVKGNSNYTVALTNFHVDGTASPGTSAMDVYRNAAVFHMSDCTLIQDTDTDIALLKISYTQARLDEIEVVGCQRTAIEISYFADVMMDGLRGGDVYGGVWTTIGATTGIEGSTWAATGNPSQDYKTSTSYLAENGKDLVTASPNSSRPNYGYRTNTDMGKHFANPNSLINVNVMDGCWNEDRELAYEATVTSYMTASGTSSVTNGNYVTVSAIIKDSLGNPKSGVSVNFSNGGSSYLKIGSSSGSSASATTNADGKATVKVYGVNTTTSDKSATLTATATVGTKSLTAVKGYKIPAGKRLVTKVRTFTASYSESYHTVAKVWNGNYTGRDVIQGTWGSNSFKGCWFFGTTMYKACMSYANIKKVRVYIGRKSGGSSAGTVANIYKHGYTSKPSGSPSMTDTTANSTALLIGSSGWVTIGSSHYADMKAGKIRGFGLSSGSYFRASGSLKVEVTYQVYETI